MNHLNSILIEGEVSQIIKSEKKEGKKSTYTFKIHSRSINRSETGGVKENISCFEIKTEGRLADACIDSLSVSRGVRVVGKLAVKTDETGNVYIQAEHIEFKPVMRLEDQENKGKASCSKVAI
jgi:hypothetical protein